MFRQPVPQTLAKLRSRFVHVQNEAVHNVDFRICVEDVRIPEKETLGKEQNVLTNTQLTKALSTLSLSKSVPKKKSD